MKLAVKRLEIDWVNSRRGRVLDFHISGRPLINRVERLGQDLVPAIGSLEGPVETALRGRLREEGMGDLRSGRVALYVCPLCGDLGCGALAARVVRDGPDIIWQDFAMEDDAQVQKEIERLGPFRFDFEQYRDALTV